jgi:hypothetical protein
MGAHHPIKSDADCRRRKRTSEGKDGLPDAKVAKVSQKSQKDIDPS